MPKNILGQPVDEEKWERAKRLAAKQGEAENYAYIMSIYKQMAGLNKTDELDEFEKSFEKSFGLEAPSGYTEKQTRIVIRKSQFMDVRCEHCNSKLLRMRRTLAKSKQHSVEIKCRKCGELNRV